MCYYFDTYDVYVLYPAIQVDVFDVQYESEEVAIMNVPYEMEFSGVGQQIGDRVMWITASATSCDPESISVASEVKTLDEFKKVTFVFTNAYRNLQLCVKTVNQPWTLLTEFKLDVLGITSMILPDYRNWKEGTHYTVVAHAATPVLFNDSDEGDNAKFIPAFVL